jgi:hypothetical protein
MAKKKTEPQPAEEELVETLYTLRRGREQPFRRTVTLGDKQVQLVFEPGVDLDLSPDEIVQCQDLIDSQMIVPATRDAKGRLRVVRSTTEAATLAALQAKNDELEARVAELTALLDEATVAEASTADGVE